MTPVVGDGQVEMAGLGKVEGTPVQQGSGQSRGLGQEDLQRALPFLAAVGPHQVEVAPAGDDLGPEVGRAGESLAIEELLLDQAVDGFDLALPGVALGRDAAVV